MSNNNPLRVKLFKKKKAFFLSSSPYIQYIALSYSAHAAYQSKIPH